MFLFLRPITRVLGSDEIYELLVTVKEYGLFRRFVGEVYRVPAGLP